MCLTRNITIQTEYAHFLHSSIHTHAHTHIHINILYIYIYPAIGHLNYLAKSEHKIYVYVCIMHMGRGSITRRIDAVHRVHFTYINCSQDIDE